MGQGLAALILRKWDGGLLTRVPYAQYPRARLFLAPSIQPGKVSLLTQVDECFGLHECLLMDQPFFRISLDGRKMPVGFSELHSILKDVVYYFELNLNEPQNVLILAEYSKLEYWKYLSVSWNSPEWAESKRYTWLCERGCLAVLNGLSLDFLGEQQFDGSDEWRQMKAIAQESLPYLKKYRPSEDRLEPGRDYLLEAFGFITEMSSNHLDEDGYANCRPLVEQGAWFTRNIVGDYFRSTAKLDFG